jgi:hypothetical protein
MEVFSAESEKLKALIQGWWEQPDQELECTFGESGAVNSTDFLAVAARLRSKGFQSIQQEDRLNILLPEHIRFTLTGNGEIVRYCHDDDISNKTFTAMIKDRTSVESNLDLKDYDVRVKSRRELPMAPDDVRIRELMDKWAVQKKAFRLIRRWTFKGKGIRFDMSMIRTTPTDVNRHYRWARKFTDHNLFKEAPIYEIEVELVRDEIESPVQAMTALVTGMGEVLRGLQKNSILIRKSQAKSVLDAYIELTGTNRFRGVAPVTLSVENMGTTIEEDTPNIRSGYNVTDKADGLRVLAFCDRKGELFLLDMALNVYRTGLLSSACASSLLDGEWVTRDANGRPINHLLLFDIYYAPGGKKVDILPFIPKSGTDESGDAVNGRHRRLLDWETAWNSEKLKFTSPGVTDTNKLNVSTKRFFFGKEGDTSIFGAAKRVLETPLLYHTDGLIFSPNFGPLPQKAGETFYGQFKWKPSEENTIDFLVNFEKDVELVENDKVTVMIHPETKETVRYKTLRLYVGSSRDPVYDDPRTTILMEKQLPSGKGAPTAYAPILFNPRDYPDTQANTCYRRVELDIETGDEYILTDGSVEPIRDGCIVEMKYVPSNEPGWRWVPLRIRHDKTERLMRGTLARTLNSEKVAESVWNSIHNPVTKSMISTGAEEPTQDEIEAIMRTREDAMEVGKKYYERKATREDLMIVRGLRDFHNRYVKEDILYKVGLAGGNKKVVDVACGKAGDLQKWRRGHASFVLGVDTAGENIRDPNNGAYRRYMDTIIASRGSSIPRMVFAIGNSSLHIVSGEAGSTPEERDILRSVFGKMQPVGAIPAYIQKHAAGELRGGADTVACMFALHYFFKDTNTLNGLVKNIDDILSVGGYFIGCCFDGDAVFDLLRNTRKDDVRVGKEGDVPIWSIKKLYDNEELLVDDSSIGLGIDVEFVSIGTTHVEYLVPFNVLKSKLAEIGLEVHSSEMFEVTHAAAERKGRKYPMAEVVREFSFLNRWFIFKRVARGPAAAAAPEPIPESEPLVQEIIDDAPIEMSGPVVKEMAIEAVRAVEEIQRTIPTTAAAIGRRFEPNEIFLFYPDARLVDSLGINDPGAGRWLSLNAPFPIIDREEDDTEVKYPTIEHYMAAMKYKKATNKPELARSLFAQDGAIHQEFESKRLIETQAGKRPMTQDRDSELLKEEAIRVKSETMPQKMKLYRAAYNEAAWASVKDDILMGALRQRMQTDARFKRAVEAAKSKGKYLLYYTGPSGASELGGVRKTATGMIEGENKVGRFIMNLANFPQF